MNIQSLLKEYQDYANECLRQMKQNKDWAKDCKADVQKLYRVKNLSLRGSVKRFMTKNHIAQDNYDVYYERYAFLLKLLYGSVSVNDLNKEMEN